MRLGKRRLVTHGSLKYDAYQIAKFEKKLMPEPNTGCFLWMGFANSKGYGMTFFNQKHQEAHRVSWRVYRGEIPEGMCVCHKCDNPPCANPDHLFLGTMLDNVHDAINKGRLPGIPKQAVADIKSSAGKIADIAKKYGVSVGAVSAIRNGRRRVA
jgi:hypothetical protein